MFLMFFLFLVLTAFVFLAIIFFDGLRWIFILKQKEANFFKGGKDEVIELTVKWRRDFNQKLFSAGLVRSDGKRLVPFKPGQYLTFLLENPATGAVLKRSYSFAAWESQPQIYELGIKSGESGSGSYLLSQTLQPGVSIKAVYPRGRFYLKPESAKNFVFIAGGIGITPLRAMIHKLFPGGKKEIRRQSQVFLFYSARFKEDLCYSSEFEDLARIHSNFEFVPVISRPDQDWQGESGRLNANLIMKFVQELTVFDYYFCGPEAMMSEIMNGLEGQGVNRARMHYEAFSISSENTDEKEYQILIKGREPFKFKKLPSLLHGFERERVEIRTECRTGTCGECRMKLLKGDVRWLIPPELKLNKNEILACACIPKSDLELSL